MSPPISDPSPLSNRSDFSNAPGAFIHESRFWDENGEAKRLYLIFDNADRNASTLKELFQSLMVEQRGRRGTEVSSDGPTGEFISRKWRKPRPPRVTPSGLIALEIIKELIDGVSDLPEIWVEENESNAIGQAAENALADAAEGAGYRVAGRQVRCVMEDGELRVFDLLIANDDNWLAAINFGNYDGLQLESKANSSSRRLKQVGKDKKIADEGCRITGAEYLGKGYEIGQWIRVPTLEMNPIVKYAVK